MDRANWPRLIECYVPPCFNAAGTATEVTDYTSAAYTGTITFLATVAENCDTIITIVDELEVEDDETFTVELSNPLFATIGTPDVVEITIPNDDRRKCSLLPLLFYCVYCAMLTSLIFVHKH